jgi:sugar/nucleoside kinase (ribokinase family)
MRTNARFVGDVRPASFDVVCAGEPSWTMTRARSGIRFRAGVLDIARRLVRRGVRVGLATVLDDDRHGRAALEKMAAMGIDVAGVELAAPGASLVVVDASGGQSSARAERRAARCFDVPTHWSSPVLLLSGLSPVTSTAAAMCKAARRARREGTTVVLDLAANLRDWTDCDPRTIAMVLRECHVVRCSLADLLVVGMDVATVRKALRPDAALVVHDATRAAALGDFGEVEHTLRGEDAAAAAGVGYSLSAAICAEVARRAPGVESASGRWHRILRRWATRPS